jgi:tetratricopeptide (TPR) repeat protein
MNKDYDEALECYSKAIEIDNKDPVYYTNSKFLACVASSRLGAAVYNTLEKFDEAITDCEKAIELNPNFVKVCIL